MSTSLQEQLQRLTVPQTVPLRGDKKRASLLFNPKEAAELSKETVYQIGLDGFQELVSKNSNFFMFESTLFNFTSKDFQRAVQTAEVNEKLNELIKKFFVRLTPYFLLSCSHKAIEWLIYRYQIHEYNRDDLIMFILPYHETNIFVRVLQLIKIKDNDKWVFLKPLQQPGLHLTKQALYNHASSNPFFIQMLSNYLLFAIKEHEKPIHLSTLFNFYCATFVGALEYTNEVNETILTQMLPIIMKGLKSNLLGITAATYIIVSKILTKTDLSEKLLNKIVQRLTMIPDVSLRKEAILVLVILYQCQKHYKKLELVSVKSLAKKKWVPNLLNEMIASGCDVKPLLGPLIDSVMKEALLEVGTDDCRKFINDLLLNLKLDEFIIQQLLNAITSHYDSEETYVEGIEGWLREVLHKIERKNPNIFDKEMSLAMKNITQNNIFEKILLSKNLQNRVDLVQKLYHPVAKIRKSAVEVFLKNFNTLKLREQEFIRNTIIDRLNDDDLEVIQHTLIASSGIIQDIIEKDVLKKIIFKILTKCTYKTSGLITKLALEILCNYFDQDLEIFIHLLPYLLPVNEETCEFAKYIIKSKYGRKCKFLKFININILTANLKFSTLFHLVLENLGKEIFETNFEELIQKVGEISNSDTSLKYTAVLFLCKSLPLGSNFNICVQVLDIILSFYKETKVKFVKNNTDINYVLISRKCKLPLQTFLNCLKILIDKVEKTDVNLARKDYYEESSESKFIVQILHILLKGCSNSKSKSAALYSDVLKIFLNHFCDDLESKLEFLLNILLAEGTFITPALKLRCIKTVRMIVQQIDAIDIIEKLFDIENVFVLYVVIGLNSKHREIRSNILDCISVLLSRFKSDGKNFRSYLEEIIEFREDIATDHTQTPIVLHNVLSDKSEVINRFLKIIHSKYPIYLKSGIIHSFSYFKDINIYKTFISLGYEILKKESEKLNIQQSLILQEIINQFNSDIVKDINENDLIWHFLNLVLKNGVIKIELPNQESEFISILLLNRITGAVYKQFQPQLKDVLLDMLIEMATESANADIPIVVGKIFKHIDMDACLILPQLIKMRDIQSSKLDLTKCKRRISVIPTLDILDTNEWKKGVTILEIIQNKKKISNVDKLLPVFFDILKKCLDFEEQASVEYPKQLILSNILHCCNKIENELPKSIFNMELVVQCIRASPNPQTHHHALLLLASVAPIIPDQVLHHIMAVFTFIGSSILRHDDAYSFQIITKIIETVIPLILTDNSRENIIKILRVFVDIIIDVPVHRRMLLYKKMLYQIGIQENLPLFSLLIFEAQVFRSSEKQKNSQGNYKTKHVDIAASLCLEFSPDIVIHTCMELFDYLKKLPIEKEDITNDILDFQLYSPKQYRHFKYTLLIFASNLLSSQEFVNQIAEFESEDVLKLEELFKGLIIKILTYIQETTKIVESNLNTPQAQYWKVMLHHAYDILDSLNALLTSQMFLLVVKGLLSHNLSAVKRRVLDLLNFKMQHAPEFFEDCDEAEIFDLIPCLVNVIKLIEKENLDSEELVVVQTALLSLKLFIRALAAKNPEKFNKILQFVTELLHFKVDPNILASAVLCLAELCYQLRGHAIPCLNNFMPVIIKILKIEKHETSPSLLLLSAITALIKILDCLAQFLSPFIEKILYEITYLLSIWETTKDTNENATSTPFLNKLLIMKKKIGVSLLPRIFIPAIENTYNYLVGKRKFKCIGPLMNIFSECLSNISTPDMQQNLPELTTLFINLLQFRTDSNANYEECNEVELCIIKTLNNFILKLSENTFRPFYYKLYDWAIRNEIKSDRIITFYSFSSAIAETLKSIYVIFAESILNNIAQTLEACNKNKSDNLYFDEDEKNILLLENVLKTFSSICLYDKKNLIQKDQFNLLMQPLVDQLDNVLGGENFKIRSKELVIPCIVNFAVDVGNDALWKQLNYQILLKMRDANKIVRMIALECLREVASKIGQDFLPLLPETVPFLAELLEDEEEDVEKACRKTVQELEKVLGESLQKHF